MPEITLDDNNFQQEVLNGKGVFLIDFWAAWCSPCLIMAPIIEEIAKEYEGKAKICKFDVQNNQSVPNMYGIRAIPTMLIFKDGQLVDRIVGAVPKSMVVERLEKQLS